MAIIEPIDDSGLLEIETWRDLVQSDSWKHFKGLLDEHKVYLERQVIVSVASKDFDGAVRYQAKAEECGKILQLVDLRLLELKKIVNKGD